MSAAFAATACADSRIQTSMGLVTERTLYDVTADEQPEEGNGGHESEDEARQAAGLRPKLLNALYGASTRDRQAESERDEKERRSRPGSPAVEVARIDFDRDEARSRDPEQSSEAS